MWAIWKARDLSIFEGKKQTVLSIVHQITNYVKLYSSQTVKVKKVRKIGHPPCMIYPCGFFDGSSATNVAGVGYSLYLNESHSFEFTLGVGNGSNTKAELLGLWALLLSSQVMGIPLSHIFGDSSVIVNWAKGSTTLSPRELF